MHTAPRVRAPRFGRRFTGPRLPARAAARLALAFLTACGDAGSPTAPAAGGDPRFFYEANDGGVPGTAPEPDANYRVRITPQSVRLFPKQVFDAIESVSQNVVSNPNYSAEDRKTAGNALRDLPRMRQVLTAPVAPPANASYLRVSDPDWATFPQAGFVPTSVELWLMMQAGGTNATAAIFGTPPGTVSFGQLFGNGAAAASENAGECGKETWEWAKSLITMTTGVLAIAGGVTATAATAGTAMPIAWGAVAGGVVTFGAGVGDLYYSQRGLMDCLMRENASKYAPRN